MAAISRRRRSSVEEPLCLSPYQARGLQVTGCPAWTWRGVVFLGWGGKNLFPTGVITVLAEWANQPGWRQRATKSNKEASAWTPP